MEYEIAFAGGHERLTNGKPVLALWIGDVETGLAKCKVLAPLLAATNGVGHSGGSQRRFA